MKFRRLAAGALAAVALGTAASAFADGMTMDEISQAARRPEDKSRQALVSVFGQAVNNPLAVDAGSGGDTVLADVFQVANAAILVIGAFIVMYVFLRKMIQAGHDGSYFDRSQHMLWGPIRLVWGLATLLPTANGWSLAQLMMLWAASTMGVGVANIATDAAVSAFKDGKGMVVQPALPDTLGLAKAVYEADLCMHSLNATLALAARTGGIDFPDAYINQAQSDSGSGFVLENREKTKRCGGASVDETLLRKQETPFDAFNDTIDVQPVYQAHAAALAAMQTALMAHAKDFVDAVSLRRQAEAEPLPDAPLAIQAAALEYERIVQQAVGERQGDLAALSKELSDSVREKGWWSLGAWYQTFAQANTKLSNVVASKAKLTGESLGNPFSDDTFRQTVMAAYRTQQSLSGNASPLGQESNSGASESDSVLSKLFFRPGRTIIDFMVNANPGGGETGVMNPLIKMKNLGDVVLAAANTITATYVVVKTTTGIVGSIPVIGKYIEKGSESFIDAVTPIFMLLIIPLFLVGIGLSVYLPLVPFIIWFSAVINWLVIVTEAIVAAPLWAISHLNGDGEGLGSRSAHGYIFLFNVMVRPLLMVIGFFAGGAILIVGGTFINEIYNTAVANVQFDSVTGIVSIIAFLAVYFSICLHLIHSCFNLIFIVPDQVINWIGGHASATLGRDANDHVKSSFNIIGGKVEGTANQLRYTGRRSRSDISSSSTDNGIKG